MPAMYSACSHQNPGTLAPSDYQLFFLSFLAERVKMDLASGNETGENVTESE
jgi:hypothetical protein